MTLDSRISELAKAAKPAGSDNRSWRSRMQYSFMDSK